MKRNTELVQGISPKARAEIEGQKSMFGSGGAVDNKDNKLKQWMDTYVRAKRSEKLSLTTLYTYRFKLRKFAKYCDDHDITEVEQITPNDIRMFLLWLENFNHAPGGINAFYRTVKAFLLWWENETEPPNWRNPIRKVKAPKVNIEPLDPVENDTVNRLLDTCERKLLTGIRDRAIMLTLLDTGVRAIELCRMDKEDFDLISGEIIIPNGKGGKPRKAYLGSKSRKAVRLYLNSRADNDAALWINRDGTRLTYWGLRMMISRRSKKIGIHPPQVHAFRRSFALKCLRAGMNIYSLQELMGHADLQVLRRYVKETERDLKNDHDAASPVDGTDIR